MRDDNKIFESMKEKMEAARFDTETPGIFISGKLIQEARRDRLVSGLLTAAIIDKWNDTI